MKFIDGSFIKAHQHSAGASGTVNQDIGKSKGGNTTAGRYFQFRLFPLDLAEVMQYYAHDLDQAFTTIMSCGGFPEPYLKGTKEYYNRWRRTHIDIILRQDLIDEKSISDIKSIELLTEMMKSRVGSGISYNNLALDL